MTPEQKVIALEHVVEELRGVVKAYAEHNAELRKALRAGRYYQLSLVLVILLSGLLKVCR